MRDFLLALGLLLAIEGICYALFPNAMRRMLARILMEPSERVRLFGLICGIAGVGFVWWVRSWGG